MASHTRRRRRLPDSRLRRRDLGVRFFHARLAALEIRRRLSDPVSCGIEIRRRNQFVGGQRLGARQNRTCIFGSDLESYFVGLDLRFGEVPIALGFNIKSIGVNPVRATGDLKVGKRPGFPIRNRDQ